MPEIQPPPVDNSPTLGLCIITKVYDQALDEKLNALRPHFDEIYVQINGGDPQPKGARWVDFSRFEWADDFAAARNALLKEVTTDYWTWMDTDDTIRNPENLRSAVAAMDKTGVKMLFAPYEYNTTDGVVSELQYRERIICTSCPGQWQGVIHETWIPDGDCTRETVSNIAWVHHPTTESLKSSMKRNRRILESQIQGADPQEVDPRHWYYLGLNYAMDKHYEDAIGAFQHLIDSSSWDEEIYRAHLQIFSCFFELGNLEAAEMSAFQAAAVLPDWPDAYFMLQQLYYHRDEHDKAIEWYKVGLSKPEPQSDSAFNPVVRHYQPHELAAYSYLAIGEPELGLRAAQTIGQINPAYQLNPLLKDEIRLAVNNSRVIAAAKIVMAGVDDPRPILEALPPSIRSDVRLTDERRKYIPGRKWPQGSIVIYCGPSFETWGPDTLDKGMGGSEEAIVYLSRELAKQGHSVTIYNHRSEGVSEVLDRDPQQLHNGLIMATQIDYEPWTEINPNDDFDTFVAWRSPAGIENIKARVKLVDLHDIISQEAVYKALPYVDKYLFKSEFHRSLYPDVPDEQAVVIGNGIPREQFSEAT